MFPSLVIIFNQIFSLNFLIVDKFLTLISFAQLSKSDRVFKLIFGIDKFSYYVTGYQYLYSILIYKNYIRSEVSGQLFGQPFIKVLYCSVCQL